jgi:cyanate permease
MRPWRREVSQSNLRQRSNGNCYLALGMAGSLTAALLGAIYDRWEVWAPGLAFFGLLCVQAACGYWFSRERVVVVQIEVQGSRERPLSGAML